MTESEQKIEATLQHILAVVEKSHRKGWVELLNAIVLSLTTMSSVWCAYQSKLWGGVQGSSGHAATMAIQQASEDRLYAGEFRVVETLLFLKFFEYKTAGNDDTADFVIRRLRPEAKAALLAWWATDPVKNKEAPLSPFVMPQYNHPQLQDAKAKETQAKEHQAAAQHAGRNADTYVLLTVLFASVLFFGGISGTFESRILRRSVLAIALLLFLVTFAALLTMPVTWS
ncbi:MAG TPA: hypothetical protein VE988_00445 [Gemmataceae bacterium]|nr:hypothetical protein [Gemmataceae bacterium]